MTQTRPLTTLPELRQLLSLPPSVGSEEAAAALPLRVPRPFLDKIVRGDLHDPLLRQVLPTASECQTHSEFSADPLGEGDSAPLLRKFFGRVLVLASNVCGIQCRFCFRRHQNAARTQHVFSVCETLAALDTLGGDIGELILSGGDPLMLTNATLSEYLDYSLKCPGVNRVRIHSRLAAVVPQRLDAELLDMLSRFRTAKPIIIVLHINHPREIDAAFTERVFALQQSGVVVLSQSVLLRGVNDSTAILEELFMTATASGIIPYYLHQLDRVAGAHDFEVEQDRGVQIVSELAARLPGYAIPRYVREVAGATAKVLLR